MVCFSFPHIPHAQRTATPYTFSPRRSIDTPPHIHTDYRTARQIARNDRHRDTREPRLEIGTFETLSSLSVFVLIPDTTYSRTVQYKSHSRGTHTHERTKSDARKRRVERVELARRTRHRRDNGAFMRPQAASQAARAVSRRPSPAAAPPLPRRSSCAVLRRSSWCAPPHDA